MPDATPAETETETVTPVPVPSDSTPDSARYPSGLAPDEVDAAALAAATERSLNGTTFSFQLDRRQARPERSFGTVYVGTRLRVRAAADGRYLRNRSNVSERGGVIAVERFRNATYVDGDRAAMKDGDGVVIRSVTDDERSIPAARAAGLVSRYLTVENATVERLDNGTAVVRGSGTSLPNASQYGVTAFVAADGTVIRFEAVFVRDNRVQFVRFRLDRNATFKPPDWAVNASG